LVGDKRDRDLRCSREVRRHNPQIPEGVQLEGIAQTVEGFALAVDFAVVVLREPKLHRKVILRHRSGNVLPPFPLGTGEKAGRHGALLSANDPILLAKSKTSTIQGDMHL
jgi:hypothetical protein